MILIDISWGYPSVTFTCQWYFVKTAATRSASLAHANAGATASETATFLRSALQGVRVKIIQLPHNNYRPTDCQVSATSRDNWNRISLSMLCFMRQWWHRLSSVERESIFVKMCGGCSVQTEAALMYDAVLLFAKALDDVSAAQQVTTNQLSCRNVNSWPYGNSLLNYMKMVSSQSRL